jgi:hypothetical protein
MGFVLKFIILFSLGKHVGELLLKCTAGDGGLQVAFQRDRPHRVVRPQLLLQVTSAYIKSYPSASVMK